MSKDLTKYVTTKQAAELPGVATERVNRLLIGKRLVGMKLGYSSLVFVPSIEEYRETKLRRGRPPSRISQAQDAG